MAQTTKHCNRCDTLLIGHEHLSDTCNRCLDLGYQSMTDEAYDAIDTHAHEAANAAADAILTHMPDAMFLAWSYA
jgi:hypothetical protein